MKKIWSYMDKRIFFISIALFTFSLIMILSASNIEAFVRYASSPFRYLYRQIFVLIVSFIAFVVVIKFPTSKYKKIPDILFFTTTGLLVALLVYGAIVNNARSWIAIGSFNLQPSELIKPLFIIFFGCYIERNKEKLNNISTILIPFALLIGVLALVALQPDFGTAIIILGIALLLFLKLKIPNTVFKNILLIVVSGVAIILLTVTFFAKNVLSEEQQARLDFRDPCSKYLSDGYQVCNGYIAINNGGLFGKGIGNSTQKYLYIPEAHTDFIFAIVMEETGLVGGFVVVGLFIVILLRILQISSASNTLRGKIIAYGIAVYIFMHIFINLMGLFGWAPYTGVPLPYLSYGGSFTLSLVISLAVVERIHIETQMYKNSVK